MSWSRWAWNLKFLKEKYRCQQAKLGIYLLHGILDTCAHVNRGHKSAALLSDMGGEGKSILIRRPVPRGHNFFIHLRHLVTFHINFKQNALVCNKARWGIL